MPRAEARRPFGVLMGGMALALACADGASPLSEEIIPPEGRESCRPEPSQAAMAFGFVCPGGALTRSLKVEASEGCPPPEVVVTGPAFRAGGVAPTAGGHTIDLIYAPTDPGPHGGRLTLRSSAGEEAEVALSGGPAPSPSPLLLLPSPVLFGSVGEGCSRARAVTLYNFSGAPLRVEAVTLAEAEPAFTLELPPSLRGGPAELPPTAPTSFDVRFRPTGRALFSSEVHVRFASSSTSGTAVAHLCGRGSEQDRVVDAFESFIPPAEDVLLVLDDTASMAEEQAPLRANLRAFAEHLVARDVDFRVGVLTTDGRGELRSSRGVRRFVTRSSGPSPVEALLELAAVGTSGAEPARPLASALAALTEPNRSGVNQGFLRDDATLRIIFVSDGPEGSPGEVDAYVEAFLRLRGSRTASRLSASAITAPGEGACEGPGGRAEADGRLLAVAERTGGVFESICAPDWARSLEEFEPGGWSWRYRHFLSREPVEGSLAVEVDGEPQPALGPNGEVRWTYDAPTNSLSFAPSHRPRAGAAIRVSYVADCR